MKKVSLFAALTIAAFTYSCNQTAEKVENATETATETVEATAETATEAVEATAETATEVVTETTEAVENATENK